MENFDPVAYRNQFKSDNSGLAGIPAITEEQKNENLKKIAESLGVPPIQGVVSTNQPAQQMPSFYQQPMMPYGMMGGFNPMGMFMNPYGGGLGGMAYNFMNSPMPLYGEGGQFKAGEYKAPEPTAPAQPSFGFSPYGGFGYF